MIIAKGLADRILKAVKESTCQKRVTVCVLLDWDGKLLACESNRCDPDGGVCARLNVKQDKENYSGALECNSQHAETRALDAVPDGKKPTFVLLFGHKFFCDDCEEKLRKAGAEIFSINEGGLGSGIRESIEQ